MTPIEWWFEDFEVGDSCLTIGRTIGESELTTFVGLAGFFEELFLNALVAKSAITTGGRRVVPGPLTFVIAEGLYIASGRTAKGVAHLGVDNLRMVAPVACGDTIRANVEVTEARRTSRPGRGIIRLSHVVENDDGEVVLTYESTRMLAARPHAER